MNRTVWVWDSVKNMKNWSFYILSLKKYKFSENFYILTKIKIWYALKKVFQNVYY